MAKIKINPLYREAFRKVFAKAASDPAFRQVLLGGNKKAAVDTMTEFLNDQSLSKEIANSIYSGSSAFRKMKPDARSLIKFMAYVFGDLPLPPPPTPEARLRSTTGDCFEETEDWEYFW